MWVSQDEQGQEAGKAPRGRRRKRRGATSMEYVVMASFILMVAVGAVRYFGYSVGALFTANASATSNVDTTPRNPP